MRMRGKQMSAKCKVKMNGDVLQVTFYGVYQVSEIIPPSLMVGGHGGGVVASPIAVIDYGDGLTKANVNCVFDIEEDN